MVRLILELEFDPDNMQFLEDAKELLESARGLTRIKKAVFEGLPSRILLEGRDE